ncbi:glycosyltransferase family 4 protein [Flavobacterium johnsoniae]|uniref:Glycosyltransferase involved in cell wall bisynthesis n=1 Tax=Flavobacterium johnsoniae TaxID=986 RepID=A0A1M5L2X4_FLAJO|nr:glycosyltransferase family 1 protein [Flavobacterium johnsoniae]SHG59346.1 Glycosyltransferase involved in cell wall bisynthesis [Flavobacterium johnsoniae]
MKIVLDPQIYNMQRYGGISRYYTEIFSLLEKEENIEIITPLNNSTNIYFNNSVLNSFRQKRYGTLIKFFKKIKLDKRLKIYNISKFKFQKTLLKGKFDLFIPTYYDIGFLKYINDKPFVLTVYDMIHELFPQYFVNSEQLVENKLFLIEKADRIIAVSENTKKDILKLYPHINKSKIDVVYHGTSIQIKDSIETILPEKYILFVGTRAIYKNFLFFINSVSELLRKEDGLFLVCAGGGNFTNLENQYILNLGLENKILFKSFADDELGYFYKHAECFVFPSQYEGFGIPILESMACGCPVVLANHSSFPEVAGDAGVYFELNDSNDLANKIAALVCNKSTRECFSSKGIDQAKKFSWQKAALECRAVYEKACNYK